MTKVFPVAYKSISHEIPSGIPVSETFTLEESLLSENHPAEAAISLYCPEITCPAVFTRISFSVLPSGNVKPFP